MEAYVRKLRNRIWILTALVMIWLVIMVVLGSWEGIMDSRYMTPLAHNMSRIIFFGSLGFFIYRIFYYKKLLGNRIKAAEEKRLEEDERRQLIHDKSGGLILDILLIFLLAADFWTACITNMAAFETVSIILAVAVILKASSYWYYKRRYS